MSNSEDSEISYSNFRGTRTLPVKIIHLRKISQENHVRRMKSAHQMKQMQESFNISSMMSPSTSKEPSGCLRTPFKTPSSAQNTDSVRYRATDINKLPSGKLSYNNISPNIQYKDKCKENRTKFTILKKVNYSSESFLANVESNLAIGDSIHGTLLGKNSFNKQDKNSSSIKSRNKSLPSAKKLSTFGCNENQSIHSDSTKNEQAVAKHSITSETTLDETFSILSEGRTSKSDQLDALESNPKKIQNGINSGKSSNEKKRITPDGKTQNSENSSQRRCSSGSKIPILLSRLSASSQKTISPVFSNTPKSGINFKNVGSVSPRTQSCLSDSIQKKSPVRQEPAIVEESEKVQEFPGHDIDTVRVDNLLGESGGSHSFIHYEDSPEMSSVSRWLKNVANSEELSDSYFSSHNDIVQSLFSGGNSSPQSEGCLESRQIVEDSGTEYDQDHEALESEGSAVYYDIEDTGGEALEHYTNDEGNEEQWQESSEDDDNSTVVIPRDKDLELETLRDSAFQELPDYPNTPYNLRYPRYKKMVDENFIRSDGKEMSAALRLLRTPRHRKKTCNSTPRLRRSCKKSERKNQASRKKDLF